MQMLLDAAPCARLAKESVFAATMGNCSCKGPRSLSVATQACLGLGKQLQARYWLQPIGLHYWLCSSL